MSVLALLIDPTSGPLSRYGQKVQEQWGKGSIADHISWPLNLIQASTRNSWSSASTSMDWSPAEPQLEAMQMTPSCRVCHLLCKRRLSKNVFLTSPSSLLLFLVFGQFIFLLTSCLIINIPLEDFGREIPWLMRFSNIVWSWNPYKLR